jgi:hypothetical protein
MRTGGLNDILKALSDNNNKRISIRVEMVAPEE